MHTGNVSVIATSAMNPMWIGLSIIHDGLPSFNPRIIQLDVRGLLVVNKAYWPYNSMTQQPITSARKSQIYVYGHQLANVSHFVITATLMFVPRLKVS
jgi:hypothetical protein